VKNTPSYILFPKMKSLRDVYVKVYTAASFANLTDGGSQGGHVIFVTDGKNSSPLAWQSNKVRRVAKSTIASETLAMVDGCESAYALNRCLAEVVTGNSNDIKPVVCVTDSHSLYDSAHTTSVLEDRRLQIEMNIIREMVQRNELILEWCKTESQASDSLTKIGTSGAYLREVLEQAHF
jgi:hypothetical protein